MARRALALALALAQRLTQRLTQSASLFYLVLFSSPALAQVPLPSSSAAPLAELQGVRVALLDVTAALRDNQRFQTAMKDLKADIDEFEEEMKLAKKKLDRRAEAVRKMSRGKRRSEHEQEITKALAEQHIQVELKKQAWTALEAQIYYEAYLDLKRQVQRHCQQQRIGMVVRFDGSPIQPTDRESVLTACNRSVVYHNHLDITPTILKQLNQPRQLGYGLPPVTRGQIPMPPAWMTTIPAIAVQQVLTARAAWTVDRLVFPPSS